MKRFKNILVYTGVDHSNTIIQRAVRLAVENEARLTFMDVVKPLPRALGMMSDVAQPEELERLVASDHRNRLRELADRYSDAPIELNVVVSIGDPAARIVSQVLVGEHDLVIKQADGLSTSGRLFGSIAKRLLRQCPCPVWILKHDTHEAIQKVLAAIDVEAEDATHQQLNRSILEIAFSIATREEAELHVVSAWEFWMEPAMRAHAGDTKIDKAMSLHSTRVTQAIDELHQAPNTNLELVHMHVEQGAAANVIRTVASEIKADLLVMGTVCRSGVPGMFIGNTAETVLTEANCSVLALKPDGFMCSIENDDEFDDSELASLL